MPMSVVRKVVIASFVGNFAEWFDYAVYGYLASIIAVVLFPESDGTAGLMMAYGVFAISFIVRPLGGLFWGRYGDKAGRRGALAWSILIMTGATFLIAFLPTYEMVGLLSPSFSSSSVSSRASRPPVSTPAPPSSSRSTRLRVSAVCTRASCPPPPPPASSPAPSSLPS